MQLLRLAAAALFVAGGVLVAGCSGGGSGVEGATNNPPASQRLSEDQVQSQRAQRAPKPGAAEEGGK